MGQPFSRRGDGSRATARKTCSGLGRVGWKRFVPEEEGGSPAGRTPEISLNQSGEMASTTNQPPRVSPISSVSMLANYDDDERMEPLTEESSWETVQLDDDNGSDGEDKNEKTKHFKYSSIKSQLDKNATKKRKRASNNKTPVGPPTPTASTSNEQWQTTTPHGNILAGKFGAKQNGNFFRAGSLPAVLSESKPMKDADRLLGVLTEHACVDSFLEEGQEAGDSVRRLIENDIGRERSVNTLLRDIDSGKSDRHLSVTAFPSMSLNVIPEIIGEEPVDPDEFKYCEMNLYF
ncbi:uncharacterized protein [Asterias amurensis]|uniref:uncharacterized protein n=1 Tax=Asterias amurensis TaxID=7602 RepID=UPI003AB55576